MNQKCKINLKSQHIRNMIIERITDQSLNFITSPSAYV